LQRAVKYLENVQELKEAVPMRRYAGSTGRSAQGMRNRTTHKSEREKRMGCVDLIAIQSRISGDDGGVLSIDRRKTDWNPHSTES
jgi:hypothetical protein